MKVVSGSDQVRRRFAPTLWSFTVVSLQLQRNCLRTTDDRAWLRLTWALSLFQQRLQRRCERGLGREVLEIDAEADNTLRDLGPHAHQGNTSAQQGGRAGGLEQRVGDLCI